MPDKPEPLSDEEVRNFAARNLYSLQAADKLVREIEAAVAARYEARIAELQRERDALRADAERYRGLRSLAREEFMSRSTGNVEFEDWRMRWKLPTLMSCNAIRATYTFDESVDLAIQSARAAQEKPAC